MNCELDNFKLVWKQGNLVFSSMHPTLEEAEAARAKKSGPTMIMELGTYGSGNYSWKLANGFWETAAHRWLLFMGLLLGAGFALGWWLRSKR